MSFLAYRTGSHDDFLLLGQRLYQHSITNSAKHSSKTYREARQRCFRLLAFISRPQVRNIHLPGRMILPGSLIPSDKYELRINMIKMSNVRTVGLCCKVATIADEARSKIIVFYDRSTNIGYKAQTLPSH